MPKPRKGEEKQAYIQRAIRTIMREEPGKDINAAIGKAYGMWRTYNKKGGKK